MFLNSVKPNRELLVGRIKPLTEKNYEEQNDILAETIENMYMLSTSEHEKYKELLGILFSDYIRVNVSADLVHNENPEIMLLKEIETFNEIEDLEAYIIDEGDFLVKLINASSYYNNLNDVQQHAINLEIKNKYILQKMLKFNPSFLLEYGESQEFFEEDFDKLCTKVSNSNYLAHFLYQTRKFNNLSYLAHLKKIVDSFNSYYFSTNEHTEVVEEIKTSINTITFSEIDQYFLSNPRLFECLIDIYLDYVVRNSISENKQK